MDYIGLNCQMIKSQIIVLIAFSIVAILIYIRAINSRKYYICHECGEKIRVEHMKANHCQVCGAPVHSSEDSNKF